MYTTLAIIGIFYMINFGVTLFLRYHSGNFGWHDYISNKE